ncbi:MAG: DUF397 domain-containing protein [Pseudonocardiales bacterium]|nr:DUF397 domain-containing protein [Pseudonocardiales bacterium]
MNHTEIAGKLSPHTTWRKSSRSGSGSGSGGGGCIEVATIGGSIGVRDSRNPNEKILVFSSCQWQGLIQTVTHESFDL